MKYKPLVFFELFDFSYFKKLIWRPAIHLNCFMNIKYCNTFVTKFCNITIVIVFLGHPFTLQQSITKRLHASGNEVLAFGRGALRDHS